MRTVIFTSLLVFVACAHDPSAGLLTTKAESRNYDCERLKQREAHERYPGVVPEPEVRVNEPDGEERRRFFLQSGTGALVCKGRFVEWTMRRGRDEWILSTLSQSVAEIAAAVKPLVPEGTVLHVDTFYPSIEVAQKVNVAARTALFERGMRVSDRVPLLAAGDIVYLARTAPKQGYPLACRRYQAEDALPKGTAFLGLMILDPREAQLHAGFCLDGKWKWLQ